MDFAIYIYRCSGFVECNDPKNLSNYVSPANISANHWHNRID